MDCAPLNLAHFHERRANKFLRYHRYDDAYKALETSLLYLQIAAKQVTIPKSFEVLETQKWEYERKLQQITIRKQQYERMKLREIVPLPEMSTTSLRPENSIMTAQSAAKLIDKTIQDFDAKFGLTLVQNMRMMQLNKENQESKSSSTMPTSDISESSQSNMALSGQSQRQALDHDSSMSTSVQSDTWANEEQGDGGPAVEEPLESPDDNGKSGAGGGAGGDDDDDDLPSLEPLELPSFDFSIA